ncbi:MAG TPA: alpha-ketoglutarate-dependent dioxygenase AlkB, partial [Acidimicrobiales bacterium]
LPDDVAALGRAAIASAYGADGGYEPDAVIANLYPPGARLGLHCDGEEPADAPVVTISLGDTCLFRFAGVDRRTAPFTDLWLRSGDLLVFGGPTRRIHHGVPKVLTGTAPAGLGLPTGRLSITVRQTGLS